MLHARIRRCLPVLTSMGALITSVALAHNGELPPKPLPPPPPPVISDLNRAAPLRWSWLHWWEANRDLYLTALAQSRNVQDSIAQVDAEVRLSATAALIAGLEDNHDYVRYTSALALGRMREASAVEPLKLRAQTDDNESVRGAAIIALGMIGDEPSRALLLTETYPSGFLRDAAVRALGMSDEPMPLTAAQGLIKLIYEDKPPFANAAVWSLSQWTAGNAEAYRLVLSRTLSPWLASDAILALGSLNDRRSDELFADLATRAERIEQLPTWAMLDDVAANKLRIALAFRSSDNQTANLYETYIRQHDRLYRLMPRALRTDETVPDYDYRDPSATPVVVPKEVTDSDPNKQPLQRPTHLTRKEAELRERRRERVMVGIEQIYQQRLRATAAIALEHAPQDISLPALHTLVQERDDDYLYNVLPKCFAAMSLGRIGSPKSLPILMEIVDERQARRAKTVEETKSPLRGFAALGLGFYAAPKHTEQGPANRPGYEKASELLATRLADKREQQEVRAACAMALGLSRRTENLRYLIVVSDTLDAQDDYLLIGYVILARAMLGDQNILDPAMNVLAMRAHRDQTTDILARRAAVLAMGVYGGDDAIPRLTQSWHESYYVNREVILGLSLCRAPGVSTAVVPILQESADAEERAFMAMVLGELFVEDRPEPLARCLNNSNFPLRDPAQQTYRKLTNEFLYDYLIVELGHPWY